MSALLDTLVPLVVKVRHLTFGITAIIMYYMLTDIRECADNNGGCEEICTDLPGGHSCSCRPGYRLLASDRSSCVGMIIYGNPIGAIHLYLLQFGRPP